VVVSGNKCVAEIGRCHILVVLVQYEKISMEIFPGVEIFPWKYFHPRNVFHGIISSPVNPTFPWIGGNSVERNMVKPESQMEEFPYYHQVMESFPCTGGKN
jgi:hypothetical protein